MGTRQRHIAGTCQVSHLLSIRELAVLSLALWWVKGIDVLGTFFSPPFAEHGAAHGQFPSPQEQYQPRQGGYSGVPEL